MLVRLLTRHSIVWFLIHLIIILAGFLFANLPSVRSQLGVDVAIGIGGSLIAGGLSGIVVYLYMTLVEKTREDTKSLFDAGLVKVFNGRASRIREEYESRMAGAVEIDVLGFGLSALRQDYGARFEKWSQDHEVRLLIIDPDFPDPNFSLANQRDREEKNIIGQIRSDVDALINHLSTLKKLNRKRFQVRKLRSIPSINIFRIDDELFFGPYLLNQASRNAPTFLVKKGGFLYEAIRQQFQQLWTSDEFSVAVKLQ